MTRTTWMAPALLISTTALTSACSIGPEGLTIGTRPEPVADATAAGAASAVAPLDAVVLSCAPNQRAQLVPARDGRPAEIMCLPTTAADAAVELTARQAATPLPRYVDEAPRAVRTVPVADPAPVAYYPAERRPAARPAVQRWEEPEPTVSYEPRRRSWQKSAVIIGSSAGAGAGVGALIGGKKGALIGAAIGGGGATVWDQATRRQR